MDKDKNKGLADNQDGEFILNESGTSVSIDPEIDFEEEQREDPEKQANVAIDEEIEAAKGHS